MSRVRISSPALPHPSATQPDSIPVNTDTIFTACPSIGELNATQIPEGQMASHLGITITEIGERHMTASMPVDRRTIQRIGILHGGASLALAETVGSIAASYCVDRTRFYIVGQEINGNHIRPVSSGKVHACATPLHLGRTSQIWDIRLTNDAGKLTCICRFTAAVLPIQA